MAKEIEYTIEIDGKVAGTIHSENSEQAARSYLLNAGINECRTIVVIRGEEYVLFGGARLNAGMGFYYTAYNPNLTRSTLDEYYKVVFPVNTATVEGASSIQVTVTLDNSTMKNLTDRFEEIKQEYSNVTMDKFVSWAVRYYLQHTYAKEGVREKED
jgi:hypothetical protein